MFERILAGLNISRGNSPIKVTVVFVVPFRVLDWGLEPGRVVKPKMTAARADTLY